MRTKTICIMAALTWLIPIGGCDSTSPERVAWLEQTVQQLQEKSVTVDAVIEQMETFAAATAAQLSDPNLPPDVVAELAGGIAQAQQKLGQARAVKARVDVALAGWQRELAAAGDVTGPGGELQVLGRGISATAPALPGPIGAYATLIGGLVTAVGGVVIGIRRAGTERDKRTASERNLTNVIHSVDSLLDSPQITDEGAAKAVLADRQGTATAAAVKAIKNS